MLSGLVHATVKRTCKLCLPACLKSVDLPLLFTLYCCCIVARWLITRQMMMIIFYRLINYRHFQPHFSLFLRQLQCYSLFNRNCQPDQQHWHSITRRQIELISVQWTSAYKHEPWTYKRCDLSRRFFTRLSKWTHWLRGSTLDIN